ncbi:MAG: integrase core domain-containing protein [Terriglobia bacterium]
MGPSTSKGITGTTESDDLAPFPLETLNTPSLNQHWFLSLPEAQQKVEAWRPGYNRVRPRSSLGNQTPEEFIARGRSLQERQSWLLIAGSPPPGLGADAS